MSGISAKKSRKQKSLTKADYERLSAVRYELRRFLGFSAKAAETVGLTPRQHQALLAIKGFPSREHVTNGELAERLQIKHHSAVGLINRLEAMGLIARERGDGDRREVHVSLTQRGAELLEQLSVAHQKELQQLALQLSQMLHDLKEKR